MILGLYDVPTVSAIGVGYFVILEIIMYFALLIRHAWNEYLPALVLLQVNERS